MERRHRLLWCTLPYTSSNKFTQISRCSGIKDCSRSNPGNHPLAAARRDVMKGNSRVMRRHPSRMQRSGMGVHVCKSVCIEEKISGREVADYVASKERNTTPNSCDQQPPRPLIFTSIHTDLHIQTPIPTLCHRFIAQSLCNLFTVNTETETSWGGRPPSGSCWSSHY